MIDIDTLEAGPELDALVAEKVMGEDGSHEWAKHPDEQHSECVVCGKTIEGSFWNSPDRAERCAAPYSTDIAAAWEVVDHMRGLGWHLIMNDTGAQYRARFWRVGVWSIDEWVRRPDMALTAWEDSAPLAICRAALKAVGA